MIWRRHRRTGPRHTPEQVAATWQVASVLLDYPDDRLVERLPLLRTAATALPGELGSGLLDVIGWLADTDLQDAQTRYVDTFDVTRRCALHLTYSSAGDTRRRGVEPLGCRPPAAGLATELRPSLRAPLGRRRRLRDCRGLAGEIPPLRRPRR